MSQNPKTVVKPNKQRQPKQKRKNEQDSKHQHQQTNIENSKAVHQLSIEEQLECFADLLIDLYLLDQQPKSDHED